MRTPEVADDQSTPTFQTIVEPVGSVSFVTADPMEELAAVCEASLSCMLIICCDRVPHNALNKLA